MCVLISRFLKDSYTFLTHNKDKGGRMFAVEAKIGENITIRDVLEKGEITYYPEYAPEICIKYTVERNVIIKTIEDPFETRMKFYPFHMDHLFLSNEDGTFDCVMPLKDLNGGNIIGEDIPAICVAEYLNPII